MVWTIMADVPNPIFDGNGDPFSGAVLKAYLPGTTTSTSIAIDSSGSSPQTSITANAAGIWEVSGNEIVPFIDREHKWAIFANASDAAANTPAYMGFFDNIPQSGGIPNTTIYDLGTEAAEASHSGIITGHILRYNYLNSSRIAGSGTDVRFTGTTTFAKANNFPDADGKFYDDDGKQFAAIGVLNGRMWGMTGNGATDDRTAFAAADANGDMRIISGIYSIQSNITITNAITFEPGAILKPANGVTITLSETVNAGNYQIFDISAGGTIAPTSPFDVEEVLDTWFGTVGDDSTNTSSALRAVIAFCESGKLPLVLTLGIYIVRKDGANDYAINFPGIDVRGQLSSTQLAPQGAVIKLDASQNCDVVRLAGTQNSFDAIGIDGNRTNQSSSDLKGLHIQNYFNGSVTRINVRNVKGFGVVARSAGGSDGPNACFFDNLFVVSSDNGFDIDTNAKVNTWGMIGVQTIDDNDTGANDETGFKIACANNIFTSMYAEDVGSGGSGTSVIIDLTGGINNVILGARVISEDADYGVFTSTSGATTSGNQLFALDGFSSGYGTTGIHMDNFSLNNTFYEPIGVDPNDTTEWSDAQGQNRIIVKGQDGPTFVNVGDNATRAVTNSKNINFNVLVTGKFTDLTGTNFEGAVVVATVSADVIFDFSGGGNLIGNGGVDYDAVSGDMIIFRFDGSNWAAFISGAGQMLTKSFTLTAAQVNALRNTPRQIVPPPGTGMLLEFVSAFLFYNFDTTAFTVGGDEDFVIQYDGSTDVTNSIESAGFIDQSNDEIRQFKAIWTESADMVALVNKKLELFNTGSGETSAGGSSTLKVTINFRVHATGL